MLSQGTQASLFRQKFVMSAEKPIGIALLVCDLIIEDNNSKKRSLIGLFNTVACGSFPATLTKLCVFVSVTQLLGKVPLLLRCRNETHGELILAAPGIAETDSPNAVFELGFELDGFSFPKPGLHTFELLHEDEIILQTRFNVMKI